MGLPDGWFSARPRERLRERERRLLDERFLLLDRLRSFLRRERLRLRLRERLLLPSSSFSWLLERERLLLFETEEASESSSRAIFCLVCRGDGVYRLCLLELSGYLLTLLTRGCGDEQEDWYAVELHVHSTSKSLIAHTWRTRASDLAAKMS